MARSYRSGWGIVLDILESCFGAGLKKTHIMYRANLNYVSFDRYFRALVDDGYIVGANDPDGGSFYMLSEKGRLLFRALREVKRKMPKVRQFT